jgi:hypothetical protein
MSKSPQSADDEEQTETEPEYDHPIVGSRGLAYTDELGDGPKPDHVTMIRQYSPATENLWAYRVDDNPDEHIVVIDDGERYHKHVKRVPAERTAVVPGEKLWTIPENWEKVMHITRDKIGYGLWRIPETNTWVKASIPTNDHVCDAWHRVSRVGDLDAEPPTEVAAYYEAKSVLDGRVKKAEEEWGLDEEQLEIERKAVNAVKENWQAFREDVEYGISELVSDPPGIDQQHSAAMGDDWEYKSQDKIYRFVQAIKLEADIDFEEWKNGIRDSIREIKRELFDKGLLPSEYRATFVIDESDIGGEFYLTGLCEAGCSPAEALDYYQVEIVGHTQQEWADKRDVGQPTVSESVSEAKDELGK